MLEGGQSRSSRSGAARHTQLSASPARPIALARRTGKVHSCPRQLQKAHLERTRIASVVHPARDAAPQRGRRLVDQALHRGGVSHVAGDTCRRRGAGQGAGLRSAGACRPARRLIASDQACVVCGAFLPLTPSHCTLPAPRHSKLPLSTRLSRARSAPPPPAAAALRAAPPPRCGSSPQPSLRTCRERRQLGGRNHKGQVGAGGALAACKTVGGAWGGRQAPQWHLAALTTPPSPISAAAAQLQRFRR